MARKDVGVGPTLPSQVVTKNYVDAANATKAAIASPTFTGTVGGITKAMVGLASVDNTTDVAKPVSTAQATALASKADLVGGSITLAQNALAINNNLARINLGVPTVTEMALIDSEMTNKLQFVLPVSIEYTTDGTTWAPHPTIAPDAAAIKSMLTGNSLGSLPITDHTWQQVRLTWSSSGYVYLNLLYLYITTAGHQAKFVIEKSFDGTTWVTHSDTNYVSSWPGHAVVSHASIPWHPTPTLGVHYRYVRLSIIPLWNGTYPSNPVTVQRIDWWGGYPAVPRQIFTWDFDKNMIFPAGITAAGKAVVVTDDARLSDARTPLAHTSALVTDFATAADARVAAGITGKVDSTDARLSDARTPLDHTQLASTISDLATAPSSVMRFATIAARDAAIPPGSTLAGMVSWVVGVGYHETVLADGTGWTPLEVIFTAATAPGGPLEFADQRGLPSLAARCTVAGAGQYGSGVWSTTISGTWVATSPYGRSGVYAGFGSTAQFTVLEDGLYRVDWNTTLSQGGTASPGCLTRVYAVASTRILGQQMCTSQSFSMSGSGTRQLAANETVRLQLYNFGGLVIWRDDNGGYVNNFSITKLDG